MQRRQLNRHTRSADSPATGARRWLRVGCGLAANHPRVAQRLNGTIPSCRRSDAVSGCARGYHRPREVASQHGHPPRQPGGPRGGSARRTRSGPECRRPTPGTVLHWGRPRILATPDSPRGPRHPMPIRATTAPMRVPSSHHEHPPAGRGHAAAEPVARLRRQDNAVATQLRQDDLTQEPEVVALQHARAKLQHDAPWQRHVRESHCRRIWLRRRFNDRRVADDSKGCASYRAFFVHRMHDLDLRLDCSPPIEASGRCSRRPRPLAGRVGESRCGIQEGDCCVGDARSCAPSCAELPGTET